MSYINYSEYVHIYIYRYIFPVCVSVCVLFAYIFIFVNFWSQTYVWHILNKQQYVP